MTKPRIAIVHEWLVSFAGAEKVLQHLLEVFPDAELYAVVDFLEDKHRALLGGRHAHTTFIQRLPGAKKRYRTYLPLMPLAIEQLDLSGYDIVISSSHAVAKGVLTGPDQLHVSYVHSPIRYAWDMQHQYLEESNLTSGAKSWLARWLLHYIRMWDHRTSDGVDVFLANSSFIARRIRKVYRRESEVVYPPVDTRRFLPCSEKQDYYLTASRLVPYKKVPLIVEAFKGMPDKRLVVIGDGPEWEKVCAHQAPNIELLGYQPFDVLNARMQGARGFVFAAEEDFGITPVEAQACGTPVIAFGKGGALETVRSPEQGAPTGMFFHEQTVPAIQNAVRAFEAVRDQFTPENCRRNAERFSIEAFQSQVKSVVDSAYADFHGVPKLADRKRA